MNELDLEFNRYPYFIDLIFDDEEIEIITGVVTATDEFEAYRIVEPIAERLMLSNGANDYYIWEIKNEDKFKD